MGLVCRWFVHLASLLLPGPARKEWRTRWESELRNCWVLVERGEFRRRDSAAVLRLCAVDFAGTLWAHLNGGRVRRWLRSPAFCLLLLAAVLAATAVLSHGFRATRALFGPPPVRDSGALVSIRYVGVAGEPSGVPPRVVPVWRSGSRLLEDLAAYRHVRLAPNAAVTTNFFSLLGTTAAAGRLFHPGDSGTAVLSGRAWRDVFGRDPRIIGRTIPVGSREYTVVGVLPESFWAISTAIAIWIPLTLEPQPEPGLPFLIGAVGRMKPGVDPWKLRSELVDVARAAGYKVPRAPQVVSYESIPGNPLVGPLLALALAVIIGACLLALRGSRLYGGGWRYWSFFAAKTALLLLAPVLLWIEAGAAAISGPVELSFRSALVSLALLLAFLIVAGCALWWSFADQRRRCPVCLHLLTMPVTIGTPGSVFEPVTTELLCEAGHGYLCLSETKSGESGRWARLDESWSMLFEPEGRGPRGPGGGGR